MQQTIIETYMCKERNSKYAFTNLSWASTEAVGQRLYRGHMETELENIFVINKYLLYICSIYPMRLKYLQHAVVWFQWPSEH